MGGRVLVDPRHGVAHGNLEHLGAEGNRGGGCAGDDRDVRGPRGNVPQDDSRADRPRDQAANRETDRAKVRMPPVDCALARDRLCRSPVFALRKSRIEKATTRIRVGTLENPSQKNASAGFAMLDEISVLLRKKKTRLTAAAVT